jgi:hypothetical protein
MHDTGIFERRHRALLGFERDRRGEQPAVKLGQHHLHGEVGLRQAPRGAGPRFLRGAGQHELQHGRAGGFQGGRRVVEAGGEGRGVEHDVRLPFAQFGRDEVAAGAILQTAHVKPADVEAFLVQRARQGGDGGEIGGEQIGPVERDDCDRPPRDIRHVEPMHPMHGDRLGGEAIVGREPSEMGHEREPAADIDRSAFGKKLIEPGERRAVHSRELGEPRVVAAIAGQERERNAGGAGGMGQFLGAVAPIIEPAKEANYHTTRMRNHLLDIEIDRHRVAELDQIGEPQRGTVTARGSPGRGGRAEVAVGEREQHEIGARLP